MGAFGRWPWQGYHKLWMLLLLGWVVSAADRTITGPVITWMIENQVSFLGASDHPHALGGLVGSLFFAGYMLTQFPGGYLGDKYGHRTIIVISILWAGVATIVSGFVTSLVGFIALRVITGLGEGAYYSNDRTLIAEKTPFEKRSFGMGVVITGLSIGITLAILLSPYLINWGQAWMPGKNGWRMPFFVLGAITMIMGVWLYRYFRAQQPNLPYRAAVLELLKYSAVFLAAIMAVYFLSESIGMPDYGVAAIELILAFLLIGFAFGKKGKELSPVLYNKNLLLLYIAAIAILWNLWFFGFWSVAIISNAADTSFLKAALTATFNAGAGILGFPAGGWLADYAVRKGWGRKGMLLSFTLIQGLLTLGFGFYLSQGGQSVVLMAVLLFVTSLFFNALQPISQALTADIAPAEYRGAAFGMWNLIGEMGAVMSPVVSGALRDATGTWTAAVMLDGALILASFVLILFVREKAAEEPLMKVAN
ncbi:sugar phosphate permease [Melghirimyces profundicolus]|uniref:Sugar phosphate permease n=1 Tax=Melghirimyces profundicolus TaxID=1242148 RepID=A0A2T6C8M9_9BACL|nr:MFS transporter [Melghirimyces profundicolus]PTX64626.1 sugar phosphate permease [Melghirimyces profundicolus]